MWLLIDPQGDVVSVQESKPEVPAGHEAVEWYGPIEWVATELTMPNGNVVPMFKGIDPRPPGYSSGRADFEELEQQIQGELGWLDATIPNIQTMTATQVRDVVYRLALENRQMIRAWKYIIRRFK